MKKGVNPRLSKSKHKAQLDSRRKEIRYVDIRMPS